MAALEYGVQTTKVKYKGLEAEIYGGCWYALKGKVSGPSLAGSGFPGRVPSGAGGNPRLASRGGRSAAPPRAQAPCRAG
jgi:hypothetical protein